DDAERLADRVDVDPAGGLLRVLALEQRRNPARVLDHLEAAGDLAERVGGDLPVLEGQEAGDVPAMLVDQLADLEEQLRAPRERDLAPGDERLLRDLNGGVRLL